MTADEQKRFDIASTKRKNQGQETDKIDEYYACKDGGVIGM